nr:MAG TPA: hypothetical protein [Caudoviricetes sp.]
MLPPVKIGGFALIRRNNTYFIATSMSIDTTRK